MKAILLRRPGGPEALEYVEVPTPVPGEGKVLVKADTIGVSMPEVLVRRGYRAAEDGSLPFLIQLTKGDPADAEVRPALEAYEALKAHLARAYGPGGVGEPQEVAEGRLVMGQLEVKAIALAEQRVGVPFFA